jgi:signal transduction histidine kinase
LIRADQADEQEIDYLSRIEAAAGRMSRLIDSLLLFATVGRGEMDAQTVHPKHVLDQIIRDLNDQLTQYDAMVELASDEFHDVVGDPELVRQIFQNLIENGIKYHRDEQPKVLVSCDRRDEFIWFSVKDNGSGLNPEDLARAFEPFQRLHAKTRHRGTGLGLSICKRAVERQGGGIRATSTPGAGSEFMFSLPRAKD